MLEEKQTDPYDAFHSQLMKKYPDRDPDIIKAGMDYMKGHGYDFSNPVDPPDVDELEVYGKDSILKTPQKASADPFKDYHSKIIQSNPERDPKVIEAGMQYMKKHGYDFSNPVQPPDADELERYGSEYLSEMQPVKFSDYPKLIASGFGRLAKTIGTGQMITSPGQMFARGIGTIGDLTGMSSLRKAGDFISERLPSGMLRKIGKETAEKWQNELSEGMKQRQALTFLAGKDEPGFFGEGIKSGHKIAGMIAQSLPETGAGMLGGAAIAKMLIKAVPTLTPTMAGIIGGAIGEGSMAGGSGAVETYDRIMETPQEELGKSPIYKRLKSALSTILPEEVSDEYTRSIIALTASGVVGTAVGSLTGILGAPSGAAMGKIIGGEEGRNLFTTSLKQSILEFFQEAPQSGSERFVDNLVTKVLINPDQDLSEGVGEEFVGGGITGGIMGGMMAPAYRGMAGKTEVAPIIPKVQVKANIVNAINEGLSTGTVGGQAVSPENVIEIARDAHSRNILTRDDIEELKKAYPKYSDGFNGIISKSIANEISDSLAKRTVSEEKPLSASEIAIRKDSLLRAKQFKAPEKEVVEDAGEGTQTITETGKEEGVDRGEEGRLRVRDAEQDREEAERYKEEVGEINIETQKVSEGKSLGLKYNGIQEGGKEPLYLFTDPTTGSTFSVKSDQSVSETLVENRKKFEKIPPAPEIPKAPTESVPEVVERTWEGPAYRVETGYAHDKGASAADVVRYEQEELGNNYGITAEVLAELEGIPATSLVWVTKNEKDAKRYGKPKKYNIPAGSRIIATDGADGGFLVLKPTAQSKTPPAPEIPTETPPAPPESTIEEEPTATTPEGGKGVVGEKIEKPTEEAEVAKKEPWEMTKGEWFDYKFNKLPKKIQKAILNKEKGYAGIDEIREQADDEHSRDVKKALSEGKPVPTEVLADYPDLAPTKETPEYIFIRKPTAKEKPGGTPRQRGFAKIEDKEGYEKVYKPYGEQGAGYYYVKTETKEPTPVEKKAEVKKAEPEKPTAIGSAWIKDKWRPISKAVEIKRGTSKGKFKVTLADGKTRVAGKVTLNEVAEKATEEKTPKELTIAIEKATKLQRAAYGLKPKNALNRLLKAKQILDEVGYDKNSELYTENDRLISNYKERVGIKEAKATPTAEVAKTETTSRIAEEPDGTFSISRGGGKDFYSTRVGAEKSLEREAQAKSAGFDNMEDYVEYQNKASREKAEQEERVKAEEKQKEGQKLDTFLSDKTPMQAGRIRKILNKKVSRKAGDNAYSGTAVDVMDDMINDGFTPQQQQVKAIKDVSRTQYNRMDQREQDAFEKKQKEAGMKTEYSIVSPKGSFWTITKAEYDYATFLKDKEAETTPTAEKAKAETPKEADVAVKETKEGTVVTTDLTKKEQGRLTLKEQKEYLLAEIDKAIEEAPETVEIKQKYWSPIDTISNYAEYIEKNIDNYITIEVPDDGKFKILNTKSALEDFKKRASGLTLESKSKAKTETKLPRPSAHRKEDIGNLIKLKQKDWFSDGTLAIKGKPPARAKYAEGSGDADLNLITPNKDTKLHDVELAYYAIISEEQTAVSKEQPLPYLAEGKNIVVFKANEEVYAFDQSKFNAIRNRYPDATYQVTEGIRYPMLVASYKGEDVAYLMPLKGMVTDLVEKMAAESFDNGLDTVKEGVVPYIYAVNEPTQNLLFDFKPAKRQEKGEVLPSARVRTLTTGNIKAAGNIISGVEDAASLLASIRKSPQEQFYTIAVDKNGTILEIHKFYKGTSSGSLANPIEVVGRAFNVDGVAKLYVAHNHPSGGTLLSVQDRVTSNRLRPLLQARGVDSEFFVIGGKKYSTDTVSGANIKPVLRKVALPVKERKMLIRPGEGKKLNSPSAARAYLENIGQDGVLFLTNELNPVAFMPFVKGKSFRETTADVLSIAESSNAVRAVGYAPSENQKSIYYLSTLRMTEADVGLSVADIITNDRSYMEAGLMPGSTLDTLLSDILTDAPVFLTSEDTFAKSLKGTTSMSKGKVRVIADKMKRQLPNLFNNLWIYDKQSDIPVSFYERSELDPAAFQGEKGARENEVYATYDPKTDTVYIVAENMKDTEAVVTALIHEGIGHRGVDGVLNRKDRIAVWKLIHKAYAETELGKDIEKNYKLDLDKPVDRMVFAKELIAHMAQTGENPTVMQRIIAVVRGALRRIGKVFGVNLKINDAEIMALIGRSYRYAEKGETGEHRGRASFSMAGEKAEFKPDGTISPAMVGRLHEVRDDSKLDILRESFEKTGKWEGRPILIIDNGNEWQALTGTHRLQAARDAYVDRVPYIEVDNARLSKWLNDNGLTVDDILEGDDYDRLSVFEKVGDKTSVRLIREEISENEKDTKSTMAGEKADLIEEAKKELKNLGAKITGDKVKLYRGGDVSKGKLKQLRYNDYLSLVKEGKDATGNEGASAYGKNVVEIEVPIQDIKITNGEIQYIGESKSLKGGKKYPPQIYKAYNDVYGSNYTAEEIDAQDNVRSVASQGLFDGREEFDKLLADWDQAHPPSAEEVTPSSEKAVAEAPVMMRKTEFDPKAFIDELQEVKPTVDQQNPIMDTRSDQVKSTLGRSFNEAMYWVVDKNRPITSVQRQLRKVSDEIDVFLKETQRPKITAAKVKKAWSNEVEPLIEKMAEYKVNLQDFELYKHALHAPEANASLREANSKLQVEKIIDVLDESNKVKADKLRDRVKKLSKPEEWHTALNQIIKENANEEALDGLIQKWKGFSAKPSGMTDAEAAKIQAQYKGDKKFEELGRMLDSINRNKLQLLYDAGLLAEEEYESISKKYKHYVPLYREGFDDVLFGASRGLRPSGRPVKVRGGSTREVVDIMAHSIANYEKAINAAEKAISQKALLGLIKANPESDIISVSPVKKSKRYDDSGNLRMYPDLFNVGQNEMRLMVSGEQYLVSVNRDNRDAMLMLKTLKAEDNMAGPIVNTLAKVNRFLARVNTSWSPEFIITNLVRDIQTAGINIKDTGVKGKGMLKGAKDAWKAIFAVERGKPKGTDLEGYYERFKMAGGKIGWSDVHGSVENLSKKITTEIEMKSGKRPSRKVINDWLKLIEDANTSIENGVRLHVFKLAVDQGKTDERAAQIASDLTVDFTKKGAAGPVINSLYLFANAGIQGSYRIMRAATKSKAVRKSIAGIMGAGFVVGMLNALAGGEDDDGEDYFNKIDDYIRERNIIIMLPGTKGKYIKIPLPWGYNFFWNIGSEASRAFTKENYNALSGAGRLAATFANAFNPVASGTLLQTLSPTVADPFAQVAENKTWFGGELMPERNKFEKVPTPDSQRYWKSAGTVSKWVASTLNSLTGGDKVKAGFIDVSPESLDLIVDNIGGSAFRFVQDSLGVPAKIIQGEKVEMHKVPFVRRVAGDKSEWADSKIFYENIEDIYIAKERLKAYRGTDSYKDLWKATRFERELMPLAMATEKRLKKLKSSLKNAQAKDSKDAVNRLEKVIKSTYIKFNKAYNKAKEGGL